MVVNTSPELSTGIAIFLTLFAAFLWGTWFISVKHLGEYPMDGYYVTLFGFSFLFVWAVGFILDGSALLKNIQEIYLISPSKIWLTLACGILYVLGMRLTLHVFSTIGFTLSQPILSSVNVMVGTLISALVGGIPAKFTPSLMVIACILLLCAIIASLMAGNLRTQAQNTNTLQSSLRFSMQDMWHSLALLTLASLLMPAYTLGLSYGLKSITQPIGLAVLPFMALLSTGALAGSLLGSGIILTRKKQWRLIFKAPWSIHKFGVFSGVFHFGGNIIHTFATASLSSVISWPLGITYTLWTLVWGIVYGEFKGSPKKSFVLLGCSIVLYLLGAYLISIQA